MTTESLIKTAISYAGITQIELARRLNTTPSNLNQKIKRGTMTMADLEKIAAAVDATLECHFVFADGTKI